MARDRTTPPAPLGRPAPGATHATGGQPSARDVNAERAAEQARLKQQNPPTETAAAYGGQVRMGIIFFPAETAGYITRAAELDGEEDSVWINRVLWQAACARVNYRPPGSDDQHQDDDDEQPTT